MARLLLLYIASIASYKMQNDTLRTDGVIMHVHMWFLFLVRIFIFSLFLFSGMICVALIQPNAFSKMFFKYELYEW